MKQQTLWMLVAILSFCGVSVVTSCSSDNDSASSGSSVNPSQTENIFTDWSTSNIPTYVDELSGVNENFTKAVKQRFPNTVSLENSEIAFIDASKALSMADKLDVMYDNGATIVLVLPKEEQFRQLMDKIGADHNLPEFPNYRLLFYAFNNRQKHFTMFDAEPFDGQYTDGVKALTEDELRQMGATADAQEDASIDRSALKLSDNNADQNENYFQLRMQTFMEWIEMKKKEYEEETRSHTRSGDGYDPSGDISRSYVDFYAALPVELNHEIACAVLSDPDCLNKNTDIVISYKIYPLYVLSCNGGDAPGDYYIVEGTTTVRNGAMWGPYQGTHGWTNDRVIGYYMRSVTTKFELLDNDDKIVDGLRFYQDPVPTTTEGSTTYTSTEQHTISASASAGYQGKGPAAIIGFGYSYSWGHSTSQTLNDVRTELNTTNNVVQWKYETQNINEERDWDAIDRDYPLLARSDFRAPTSGTNNWVWKVPYGRAGVADNSGVNFKIRVTLDCTYGCWNWWRGAASGNSHTFNNDRGTQTYTQTLAPLNRVPFGVLALKNAANNTVANITVYQKQASGEYTYYGDVPSSYNVNEIAKTKLPVGTYRLEYQTIDPNNGNKVLDNWRYDNISVHMGKTEAEGTTEVSTVNAVKI